MDTILSESIGFNPAPPTLMHIDLNSCFATIEQQANPLLRGKPLAVAAYTTGGGCILAASIEAKRIGVKTGLRVREGKALCPNLIVLPPDPNKYRFVNRKLLALLQSYSAEVEVKSIDEMVVNFHKSPKLFYSDVSGGQIISLKMKTIAGGIKTRIKAEIGEWLTVSIGIAPNRYLAKIASELHKPDGLDVIYRENIETTLNSLELEKLCGIKKGYGSRLRMCKIDSAIAFYKADIKTLRMAFHSVVGYHWWLRLHGYEADDREFGRKSFGHSYALHKPYPPSDARLAQILCQLTIKMGRRLRADNYTASGMHLSCLYADYTYWHHGEKQPQALYDDTDLYRCALNLLHRAPDKPVRILAVSCFDLVSGDVRQLRLDGDDTKKEQLVKALDKIADKWGEFTVFPAGMMNMEQKILDRIAFGGVKGLEEFIFREPVEKTYN
jgi:DNA polymerase IV